MVHYVNILERVRSEPVGAPVPFDRRIFREPYPEIALSDYEQVAAEFDESFYQSQVLAPIGPEIDLIEHFLSTGWKEGYDPSPAFSVKAYLQANPDVRDAGHNPFVHYLRWGRDEGRPAPLMPDIGEPPAEAEGTPEETIVAVAPSDYECVAEEFDPAFYLTYFLTPPGPEIDLIEHFLSKGWIDGYDPSPAFSVSAYLEANPDVRSKGVNPFVHYLQRGRLEGRRFAPTAAGRDSDIANIELSDYEWVAPEFDSAFYLRHFPEPPGSEIDLIEHFLSKGHLAGFDPSPTFSVSAYLDANADVRTSGFNPFVHYIRWGRREGRDLARPVKAGEQDLRTFDLSDYELVALEFDDAFYLGHFSDHPGEDIDLIEHFLSKGWSDGWDPSASFSLSAYLEANPDVGDSAWNPFVHYLRWGRAEGRSFSDVAPAGEREDERVRAAFDEDYYLASSPDLQGSGLDLFEHYMNHGWRELRDPSPTFNTRYYLEKNEDIKNGGGNPFKHFILHGISEGRRAIPYETHLALKDYAPLVTAIVPNFNHARFLQKRLDCILNQTYENLEVLILDDCSTDDSRTVIADYAARYPQIRTILNTVNSGGVFKQWRKGIESAAGEVIWICESDDFCELDFLEHCVRPLVDESVMVAFGRIQFSDAVGNMSPGLDEYRERAAAGIWSQSFKRPAHQFFRGGFGKSNLIPNVGGCVFRNQSIPEEVWDELVSYKICGDWYLYSILAGGGQMAYAPDAVAYFRQHGKNTSVKGFIQPKYYAEHQKIMVSLRERWGTPDDIALEFYFNVYRQFVYSGAEKHIGALTIHYHNEKVLRTKRSTKHVLVATLGFHLGGGEIFPIHLANTLVEMGYLVSFLITDGWKQNATVRNLLDRRVAVYDAHWVTEIGIDHFIETAGIDLVHSHVASVEYFFFGARNRCDRKVRYIVTLHGSYEVTPMGDDMLFRLIRGVDHWTYLSAKNLAHLDGVPLDPNRVTFIPNGMPSDDRPFPISRAELGVPEGGVLFTLASRAIKEKGWRVAIEAKRIAQRHSEVPLHLMLCGSGPELAVLQEEFSEEEGVHFVGYQECINGAYAISDVAILPSRFEGESFPLTLIQAMHMGAPIIATDIGEIRKMLTAGEKTAGILVPNNAADDIFTTEFSNAMIEMTRKDVRDRFSNASLSVGSSYTIEAVAKKYTEIFKKYLK